MSFTNSRLARYEFFLRQDVFAPLTCLFSYVTPFWAYTDPWRGYDLGTDQGEESATAGP